MNFSGEKNLSKNEKMIPKNLNLNFDSQEKDKKIISQKVDKNLVSAEEKEHYAQELSKVAAKLGNKLQFFSVGETDRVERELDKINERVQLGLDKEQLNTLRIWIRAMEKFVVGPVFTDEFHEDHYQRRKWEYELSKQVSPKIMNYYHANRLGYNNIHDIIPLSQVVIDYIQDQRVKHDLKVLVKQFPKEYTEKNTQGHVLYHNFRDAHKIASAFKMTAIVNSILNYLEPLKKDYF